jgi:hypothetical protein
MRINFYVGEHLFDLLQPPAELVKLAKDQHFREVELPLAVAPVEPLLRLMERLLIVRVQPDAVVEPTDDCFRRQTPDCLTARLAHVRLTRGDHLVRYLHTYISSRCGFFLNRGQPGSPLWSDPNLIYLPKYAKKNAALISRHDRRTNSRPAHVRA